MQKMKVGRTKRTVATAIMAGALALFAGKTSAGVIPKSSASTFYEDVPGLSLAPSKLAMNKSTKGVIIIIVGLVAFYGIMMALFSTPFWVLLWS